MANKVYNLSGGLYSGNAFTGFEADIPNGEPSDANKTIFANSYSYTVSAGTGMNVVVGAGSAVINNGASSGYRVSSDAENTVAVSAASSANPRMDAVVMYVDTAVSASTSVVDNADLGILKFKCVAGTPAASPTGPAASTIQASIGAGNAYAILCYLYIPTSATAASSFTFYDRRKVMSGSVLYNPSLRTDTPAEWQSLIGTRKYATAWFDKSKCFANQPSQYGFLEIMTAASGNVAQVWTELGSGKKMKRAGNSSGWSSSASFKGIQTSEIADSAVTTAKLADASVTSDKVGWTTLKTESLYSDGDQSITAGAWVAQTVATLDVSSFETGANFVVIAGCTVAGTGTYTEAVVNIKYNSSTREAITSQSWYNSASVCGIFTKASGVNSVTLSVARGATVTMSASRISMIAFRVS